MSRPIPPTRSRRRLRRRNRRADGSRPRPRAAIRQHRVRVDRSVDCPRRRRHRLERHRGHAGPPGAATPSPFRTTIPRGPGRPSADAARFRTLADLRGRRVATLGGTIAYEILLRCRTRSRHRRRCRTTTTCILTDLVIGRLDAVLLDNVLAERRRRTTRDSSRSRKPSRSSTTSACWRRRTQRCATASTRCCRGDAGRPLEAIFGSGGSGTTTSRSCTRGCWPASRRPPVIGDDTQHRDAVQVGGGAAVPAVAPARVPVTLVLSCWRWGWPSPSAC